MKLKLGVLCPSEIAFRRFMPSLIKGDFFEYVGISKANRKEWFDKDLSDEEFKTIDDINQKKAEEFINTYGGKIFNGYQELIESKEIDAIYIPLPPALHFEWAKLALKNNLHVLVEKPATTNVNDTRELINIAKENNLALHENYMFVFHSQLEEINKAIKSDAIGEVRLIRIDFGFPDRGKNDFRYNKSLGGGALLDCGGYVLKYADILLGYDSKIVSATLNSKEGYEVDIYGSGSLINNKNQCVQVSFGMDNDYRCSIDVWGSKGTLRSNRVLTAQDGFTPSYRIEQNGTISEVEMKPDDSFYKSIEHFYNCIKDKTTRRNNYETILKQTKLVDEFLRVSKENEK